MLTSRAVRGFTVIELLIVVAIVSLLVSLSLPAIQASREAARRSSCANHQRQFGVAFTSFEARHKTFPACFTLKLMGPLSVDPSLHMHNFVVDLLPYLEERAVYARYDLEAVYCAPQNVEAIQTPLAVAVCPSAPRTDLQPTTNLVPSLMVSKAARERLKDMYAVLDKKYSLSFRGAVCDYSVVTGVGRRLAVDAGYQVPTGSPALDSMFPSPLQQSEAALASKIVPIWFQSGTSDLSIRVKGAQITDGLSHTLMLVEVAGRPLHYRLGQRFPIEEPLESAWADPYINIRVDGIVVDDRRLVLQTDNKDEMYSFHPSGVNCVFADGHVATLAADSDPRVVIAMVTPREADSAEGRERGE
jgi:prepilin-type N-terminal cleavage/methylation domain-containing protein/prepilin-type processing-associated H-X9-DG protein